MEDIFNFVYNENSEYTKQFNNLFDYFNKERYEYKLKKIITNIEIPYLAHILIRYFNKKEKGVTQFNFGKLNGEVLMIIERLFILSPKISSNRLWTEYVHQCKDESLVGEDYVNKYKKTGIII